MHLAGELLVFGDPCVVHVLGRVVHHRHRLHLLLVQRLVEELERAVGQGPEAVVEELVDRPGVDQVVELDLGHDLAAVGVEHQLDVVMIQHVLEHAGVAVQRHHLVLVGEIAVVVGGAGGDARGHRAVELGRVQAPHLARVAAKELLVELAPDRTHDHVLGGLDLGHGLGARAQEGLDLVGAQGEAVEAVDRGAVDRHRHQHVAHRGQDAVLVRAPRREPAQIVHDRPGVGVEDVRPVAVDHDAGGVVAVVGVAADVRPAVDEEDALVGLGGQTLGQHAAGEASADDKVVKAALAAARAPRHQLAVAGGQRQRRAPHRARRLARHRTLDQPRHALEGGVPGVLGQELVDRAQPVRGEAAEAQGTLDSGHEALGRVSDRDRVDVAVVPDHVGDRGRDHGQAGGQVLGRLGRADEARRFVARERHQGDVPAGEVARQVGVLARAQIVDVGPPWQVGGVDLHDRPHHDELPVRPAGGQGVQELEVHALVDDAAEAQPRVGDVGLVGGLRGAVPGGGEVRHVDAAGEGMDRGVQAALGLVEAEPAGEDEVGALQEQLLALDQRRRREAERRQFVHAVVDHRRGVQMVRERPRHRRVVPQDRRAQLAPGAELVQEPALGGLGRGRVQAVREVRRRHGDPVAGAQLEHGPAAVDDRLLDVGDGAVLGEAAHQVLRPLDHEVPAQVREAEQVVVPTARGHRAGTMGIRQEGRHLRRP